MHQTIEALESAIATLETYFQSIEFVNEEQAAVVSRRLLRAEARLNALTFTCRYGRPSGDDWTTEPELREDANDQR
jgi:hypothetical protein